MVRRRVQRHGGWLWSGRPGNVDPDDTSATSIRNLSREGPTQDPLFRDGLSPSTPIQTDDVEYAAKLLGTCREANRDGTCKEMGYYVELKQPRQVSTLLDKLAEMAREAQALGEDAPVYDLCKVSVPRTNLFCAESKGIKRVMMPQLSGKPIPGSPADFMAKNAKGEVDLGPAFHAHLQNLGYVVVNDEVDASVLRASQAELDGAKTGALMNLIDDGTIDTTSDDWRVWTTEDDYIIDGHHRWSAAVGAEFKAGSAVPIAVTRVNVDIITALAEAVKFTSDMGIPPRGVGK